MIVLLIAVILLFIIVFLVKLPSMYVEEEFTYSYFAKTIQNGDNEYYFTVHWVDNGYRCYIDRVPSFRGRDTSHYMPHYWEEKYTNRHFICWTENIIYPEQAKTLCRNWADATQQFIDTGIPAMGFER